MSRRKETIKIRAEINKVESKKRKRYKRSMNLSSGLFEKVTKIDNTVTRLIKKKRQRTRIHRIGNESGEVTTDTKETQRTVGKCYKQLHTTKQTT